MSADLRKLSRAATKGPWSTGPDHGVIDGGFGYVIMRSPNLAENAKNWAANRDFTMAVANAYRAHELVDATLLKAAMAYINDEPGKPGLMWLKNQVRKALGEN